MSIAHPLPHQLAAYALGTLDSIHADAVGAHVEQCPQCEATMANLERSGDTFVSQLRAAPPVHDPTLAALLAQAEVIVLPAVAPAAMKQLRDYEVLTPLGKGGMGAVYRARHVHLDRVVALKILPPERTRDTQAVARFRREMRAIGKLQHPNIVVAHDAGEVNSTHFLVMELVDGVDASRLVRSLGPLPIADAVEIIRQAACGLAHAHEHGLVHRDVKPSNLIVTRAGQVKVLDLGLALLEGGPAGEELTAASQAMGTADYVAPEQTGDSHAVDIRADLYSLGCTLYRLLTGDPPFTGPGCTTPIQKMMAHVGKPAPSVRDRRPDASSELAAIVARMMAKQPADRYQTPAEVEAALAPLARGASLAPLVERAMVAKDISAAIETSCTPLSRSRATTDCEPTEAAPVRIVSPSATAKVSPAKRGSSRITRRHQVWIAAALAGALLVAAAVVIRVRTADGTLVLTVDDPNVEVVIDGDKARVKPTADGKALEISVDPGRHELVVTTPEGVRLKVADKFTIDAGGKTQLTAVLERDKPVPPSALADLNRAVAEWVLSVGGTVQVLIGEKRKDVASLADLPSEVFQIRVVDLNPTSTADADLTRLEGLQRLEVVSVGADATDAAFARLSQIGSLTEIQSPHVVASPQALLPLAELPNLQAIWIRNTTPEGVRVLQGCPRLTRLTWDAFAGTEEGFGELSKLVSLETLSIRGTEPRREPARNAISAISKLSRLKTLSVHNMRLGIELVHLSDLQQLSFVSFHDCELDSPAMAALQRMSQLWRLKLHRTTLPPGSFAEIAKLAELVDLYPTQMVVAPGDAQQLTNMKKLLRLDLSGSTIVDRGAAHLAQVRSLKELKLEQTALSPAALERLKSALPQCKIVWTPPADDRRVAEWVLSVGGNIGIHTADDKYLRVASPAELPEVPFRLSRIGLANCQTIADADFERLRPLTLLAELSLENTPISDAAVKLFPRGLRHINMQKTNVSDAAMAHLAGCSNLETLNVNQTKFTDYALRNVRWPEHVKTLTLSGPSITDNCASQLASLRELTSLTLEGTRVSDAGLAQLTPLKLTSLRINGALSAITDRAADSIQKITTLERLALHNTRLGDAGLAKLAKLEQLKDLDIGRTPVTDAGLAEVAKLKAIEELSLIETQITNVGLGHLKSAANLMLLKLQGTKVSPDGVQELKAALPNCTIEWSAEAPKAAANDASAPRSGN